MAPRGGSGTGGKTGNSGGYGGYREDPGPGAALGKGLGGGQGAAGLGGSRCHARPVPPPHGRPVSPQAAIAPRLRCRSCSSSTAGTAPHISSWKRSCSCTKVSLSLQNSSQSRRGGQGCGAEGGAFPAVLLLPYPVSNLVVDVVLLLLYLGIEAARIFFGESPRIPEAPQGVQSPGTSPKSIPGCPGWMGRGATWASGGCPCPQERGV